VAEQLRLHQLVGIAAQLTGRRAARDDQRWTSAAISSLPVRSRRRAGPACACAPPATPGAASPRRRALRDDAGRFGAADPPRRQLRRRSISRATASASPSDQASYPPRQWPPARRRASSGPFDSHTHGSAAAVPALEARRRPSRRRVHDAGRAGGHPRAGRRPRAASVATRWTAPAASSSPA
jgi:hypothetical protein